MTDPTTFTLRLLSLRCVAAQEAGGDEIYLEVNGHTIWSVGTMRMTERPADHEQISEVDFANGRKRTVNSWEELDVFQPENFVFADQTDFVIVRVMERDLLLGDDLLGEARITAAQAASGQIQQAFTNEGAHYMLTYQVTTP